MTTYNHGKIKLQDQHVFAGDGNQYLCSICKKPRALHEQDGFVPGQGQPHVTLDPNVRYGGRPLGADRTETRHTQGEETK
jgi:hypothetical protein